MKVHWGNLAIKVSVTLSDTQSILAWLISGDYPIGGRDSRLREEKQSIKES